MDNAERKRNPAELIENERKMYISIKTEMKNDVSSQPETACWRWNKSHQANRTIEIK